ncbi:LysR family transcriptional regulator [Nocardioides insulae]|uniref:LysR family transcriptional regulator n=1 Tax=Nocardioides insulae TaxID=394734 RepID=UPI00040B92D4|nr:LysR family transcriptional regulator [Nocardioides insulae]
MQFRDLGWLVTLADVGHMTDAAAVLRTSQPTLSRALARVEAELDARLFERVPSGLHTTPAGRKAVEAARDLTARYQRLRRDLAADVDPDGGVVRLAFLDSIATSLVPRVLGAVHVAAPGLRVELAQEPGHEILADLDRGEADLAILSPEPEGGYGWLGLQEERLALVVPPRHRLAGRDRVALSELEGEEMVTAPEGFGYRRLVDGLLRETGVSTVVSFQSQDLATIEGLVAAGLGVAILPETFAGASGSTGVRITTPGARRTIGLAWRTDRDLSPPVLRFRDLVRERF